MTGLLVAETHDVGAIVLELFLPLATVLVVSRDGLCASVQKMRPCGSVMVDFSPESLMEAVLGPDRCAGP